MCQRWDQVVVRKWFWHAKLTRTEIVDLHSYSWISLKIFSQYKNAGDVLLGYFFIILHTSSKSREQVIKCIAHFVLQ